MNWQKILDISKKGKKGSIILVVIGVLSYLGFSATEDIAEYNLITLDTQVME